jgi:hypothetical protein
MASRRSDQRHPTPPPPPTHPPPPPPYLLRLPSFVRYYLWLTLRGFWFSACRRMVDMVDSDEEEDDGGYVPPVMDGAAVAK